MGNNPGVLRRTVTRLATSAKEHEAQELQKSCVELGAVPVDRRCRTARWSRVAGTLRTVTLRPRAGVPALEAELYDGTGVDHPGLAGPPADRRHRAGPRRSGRLRPGRRATTSSRSSSTRATSCGRSGPSERSPSHLRGPVGDRGGGSGRLRHRRGGRPAPALGRARRPARHGRGRRPDARLHRHLPDHPQPAARPDRRHRPGGRAAGASGWCSASPCSSCVNSLVGIGIGAVFAVPRRGNAEGRASCPGIIYNAAYAVVMVLSVLVRWPLVGFMVGSVTGDPTAWRSDPAVVRLCSS